MVYEEGEMINRTKFVSKSKVMFICKNLILTYYNNFLKDSVVLNQIENKLWRFVCSYCTDSNKEEEGLWKK